MIIVVLTDCPPKLRGDLSKWLFEINTGVYVGNVSARVREALWIRICETVQQGQATMVYPAPGEQKMEFRVHNTTWEMVDYDGIKLMRRPLSHKITEAEKKEKDSRDMGSKAAAYQRSLRIQRARQKAKVESDYTVLDLETTGLSHLKDHIIEIAALRVRNGFADAEFHALVQCPIPIPPAISALTGLTDEQLVHDGRALLDVLKDCLAFIGSDLLVLHHAAFDYGFLQAGCKKVGLPIPRNQCMDTLKLARQKLAGLNSYSLEAVSTYFGLDVTGCHRAQKDCELTLGIYQKLKEK
jgi:CRISPR-associated protein Cas2